MGQIPNILKSEIIESLRETMTTNPTIPVPTNKYENNSENKKDNCGSFKIFVKKEYNWL